MNDANDSSRDDVYTKDLFRTIRDAYFLYKGILKEHQLKIAGLKEVNRELITRVKRLESKVEDLEFKTKYREYLYNCHTHYRKEGCGRILKFHEWKETFETINNEDQDEY